MGFDGTDFAFKFAKKHLLKDVKRLLTRKIAEPIIVVMIKEVHENGHEPL